MNSEIVMSAIDNSIQSQLTIHVISDIVCPWCYIGKYNLQTALDKFKQAHPKRDFTVRWIPYFLNPEIPMEGSPYRAFLEKKFGGSAHVDVNCARVTEVGKSVGIEFSFDSIKLRANTLNAHRLIHRFQQRGDADALVERLYEGYFLLGEHISDVELLADIAAECGDDADAVHCYLDSTQGQADVMTLAAQVQESGVISVPFFIFNRRLVVSGAQLPEVLLDAMFKSVD